MANTILKENHKVTEMTPPNFRVNLKATVIKTMVLT
jgi:hypothetical protein